MPLYKYFANHLLNFIQNSVYQLKLSDYATGYKAYSNKLLTSIPYHLNRNDFIFDEQLNTQIVALHRIIKTCMPYLEEARKFCTPRIVYISTEYIINLLIW